MCENCERLKKRIKELEDALQNVGDEAYEAEQRMTSRLEERGRELYAARKAEQEARDAEYFREDTVKRLERARSIGDHYDEDRLIAKLKRGWL